ncbi:hypothetical protein RB213_012676 [Colletotrichum asianum]
MAPMGTFEGMESVKTTNQGWLIHCPLHGTRRMRDSPTHSATGTRRYSYSSGRGSRRSIGLGR